MSVSVCVFVREHISKTALSTAARHGPALVALRFVVYFRFCGLQHDA